jgi:hypothetical protein
VPVPAACQAIENRFRHSAQVIRLLGISRNYSKARSILGQCTLI